MSTFQDGVDVAFAHDQIVLAFVAELGAAVLAVEDIVADLHAQGGHLAVVGDAAHAHGDDLATLGLFLGRVGDDDATLGGLFSGSGFYQHAVRQRFHCSPFG
jgi:hypothetical protein